MYSFTNPCTSFLDGTAEPPQGDQNGVVALPFPLGDQDQQLGPAGPVAVVVGDVAPWAQADKVDADIEPLLAAHAPAEDVVRMPAVPWRLAPLAQSRPTKLVQQGFVDDVHCCSFLSLQACGGVGAIGFSGTRRPIAFLSLTREDVNGASRESKPSN